MSLMNAKWLKKSGLVFDVDGTGALVLRFAPTSAIEATVDGLQLKTAGVTDAMLASDYILADGTRAMAADLNMGGNKISNLAAPLADSDAATRRYVDDRVNGIDRKASVRVTTTENISLTGLQTVDGVALSAGDRVLVKNQTDATTNGIYDVVDGGAWDRSEDCDGTPENEVTTGMFTFVEEGSVKNKSTGWSLATTGVIELDVTALEFVQTSSVGEITADGFGIVKTGTELSLVLGSGFDKSTGTVELVLDGGTLAISAAGLKVAAAGISEVELAAASFGSGLTGGSGAVVKLGELTENWALGGTFGITGLKTPVAPTDAANKQYVDDAVAAANNRKVELFTLDATDITNGYVDLSVTPAAANRTVLGVGGAPSQTYGDDFQVITDGTSVLRLSWAGLGLDTLLVAGDKLTVTFDE